MQIAPASFLVTYFIRDEVAAGKPNKYEYQTRDTTAVRAVNSLVRDLKEAGTIKKASELVIREVRVVAGV
ncbi:hypothetical protein [Corynebacterium matruchotii]|jgi:hypothetical protein